MKKSLFLFVIILLLTGCANNKKVEGKTWTFSYANGIKITECKGYYYVQILDPWNYGKELHNYVLIPRDSDKPDNLPDGTVVRYPLKKSLVYSSVHSGLIKEITGSYSSIGGVCDAQYFTDMGIKGEIASGRIKDCGNSLAPTTELIIELDPDAILLSPFQNVGYGALEKIGVPIIECADYMENTPLGRAEWVKFFGLLYGNEAKGNEIFQNVKKEYVSLAALTADVKKRPKVITETVQNGVWYVPGGNSYMAHLMIDAGADYPFKNDKNSGSLELDFTQVLDKAGDADIWLIKSRNKETYSSLASSYSLNKKIKAYQQKNVYMCDIGNVPLFDEFPFHPEKLLKDYISIFHPDIVPDYKRLYFHRLAE